MTATAGPDPAERLAAALEADAPDRSGVLVAFSGGADSTLLLQLAAEQLPRRRVRAVHVHHGWRPEADDWARHCHDVARGLRVRCEIVRVDAGATRGEGAEAAAREARYAALRERLRRDEVLLTAHHRDDQAETLLLALLRGGGVHGWSGMPADRPFGAGRHIRPWLAVPRDTLHAEVRRRGLRCLEDPANADPAFDRAWLRGRVLPLLRERYPGVDETLARATGQAADAAAGVDALAAHDFVRARGRREGTLDCEALGRLPAFRQRALLRWWLRRADLPRPGAARLESLRHQLIHAAADRNPRVAWTGAEVRRWRGEAWALAPLEPIDPAAAFAWSDRTRPLVLPHRTIDPDVLASLPVAIGADSDVRIAFRQGGERLPRQDRSGTVALKRWLADRGVPPWERDRMPLLYVDGELVAAIGVPPP